MRRAFLGGVLLASAVGALSPRIVTGNDTAIDDRGLIEFEYVRLYFGRWGVQVNYWSEIPRAPTPGEIYAHWAARYVPPLEPEEAA